MADANAVVDMSSDVVAAPWRWTRTRNVVVTMPAFETAEPGAVRRWLVPVGELVQAGDPLVIVTDGREDLVLAAPAAGIVLGSVRPNRLRWPAVDLCSIHPSRSRVHDRVRDGVRTEPVADGRPVKARMLDASIEDATGCLVGAVAHALIWSWLLIVGGLLVDGVAWWIVVWVLGPVVPSASWFSWLCWRRVRAIRAHEGRAPI